MPEDRQLQSLEVLRGLQTELLLQQLSESLVCGESIRLPSRPIQREHQASPQGLAERMDPHQRIELGDQLGSVTQLQACLDPQLHCAQEQLIQAVRFELQHAGMAEFAKRSPPPQRHCRFRFLGGEPRQLPAVCRLRVVNQPLEPDGVDPIALDSDRVTR